jgi:riboflavin kinase
MALGRITGRVETGQGVGASFTRTDWALGVFRDAYGLDPFPGTLNVRADAQAVPIWLAAVAQGRLFKAPDPAWCDARCLRALLQAGASQAAAVAVVPLVPGYPSDQIELVADRRLRETLGLSDGDAVVIALEF